MSHVVVDGYNLIGTGHRDFEKARAALIARLISYRAATGHDLTLVFDGHQSGPGPERASVQGRLKIIYSGLGERADDVIKRIISRERRDWIVITSDRDIAAHAWAVEAVAVPSAEFEKILGCTDAKAASPDAAQQARDEEMLKMLEEDEDEPQRSGNPRRLSKRDRALRRALEKLAC
jgi:hypothetical protein